jgi:hypothetical protein
MIKTFLFLELAVAAVFWIVLSAHFLCQHTIIVPFIEKLLIISGL